VSFLVGVMMGAGIGIPAFVVLMNWRDWRDWNKGR
jgi:hypothetical protein